MTVTERRLGERRDGRHALGWTGHPSSVHRLSQPSPASSAIVPPNDMVGADPGVVAWYRAGRLRTVDAITVSRTPRAGRGRRVRTLVARLSLPRAISLGLVGPFARPGRSATMVTAVLLGAVGVTFGAGLAMSFNRIQAA